MLRNAMIHSTGNVGMVEVIEYVDCNNVTVRVVDTNVVCSAVDNQFTGLIYADDIYGVMPQGK